MGVVWDVRMHNSVCHSSQNEARRKWDPQMTVGVSKNVNPFSRLLGCAADVQVTERAGSTNICVLPSATQCNQ